MTSLSDRLAAHTGTAAADWFPVFKARYGMLAVFRALAAARPASDDVVTQVLTCSTAVDPILVAGLTPVYAEVSPVTFGIDPACLALPDGGADSVGQVRAARATGRRRAQVAVKPRFRSVVACWAM